MRRRVGWLAALAIAISGCGGESLPLVSVKGVVTFGGGDCPAPGNVTFQPLEVAAGLPHRPASAKFGTDGRFEATSFRPGDGLVPGSYKVSITCYTGLPDPSSKDPFGDINEVPSDYAPEVLVVEADSDPVVQNYDVPLKKGRKPIR